MQERHLEMAAKRASEKAKSQRVFGQARKPAKMFRAGLYARVSTSDQQTIPLQIRALREYAARRGWTVALQVKEVGSGASQRQLREKLLDAARRREIDVVLVWRLDRWGRSVADLLATLQELDHLGVGFVSLTEALDLTTPAGRAMAALLAVFAEFEREILCAPAWPTRGRTARSWAGPSPPDSTPSMCESCIVPAPAKPTSPAACRLAAPPCAVSWADLFPGEIGASFWPTQAYRKDTLSHPRGPLHFAFWRCADSNDPNVFGHLLSLGQDVFESHSVVGRSHAKLENDSLVRDFAAANFLGLGLKVIESNRSG